MRFQTFCIHLLLSIPFILPAAVSAEKNKVFSLPKPRMEGGRPLMEVLKDRKSSRAFSSRKLPTQVLSDMLWAAYGVNRPVSGSLKVLSSAIRAVLGGKQQSANRTAPSAMNGQEIDIYVATGDGLHLYDARGHSLNPVLNADIRANTGRQPFAGEAPVNLIYVADLTRMKKTSAEDKVFYSAADTGFISQNVYLYCASQGLATVVRGSIDRSSLGKTMRLRPDQKIILAQSVGYPK